MLELTRDSTNPRKLKHFLLVIPPAFKFPPVLSPLTIQLYTGDIMFIIATLQEPCVIVVPANSNLKQERVCCFSSVKVKGYSENT